jgi:hypothetical protein
MNSRLVHQVSDWCSGRCDQNGPPARRDEGAYLDRYVTEEQRSCRPIFIATLRAARLLTGCFVAHRSKTTVGILPLRFAHPVKIPSSVTTPVTDSMHRPFRCRNWTSPAVPSPLHFATAYARNAIVEAEISHRLVSDFVGGVPWPGCSSRAQVPRGDR